MEVAQDSPLAETPQASTQEPAQGHASLLQAWLGWTLAVGAGCGLYVAANPLVQEDGDALVLVASVFAGLAALILIVLVIRRRVKTS